MKTRSMVKEYSNKWASVERMSDGTFDLYNNVTGEFVRTVKSWGDAKGHLADKRSYYGSIERKFA